MWGHLYYSYKALPLGQDVYAALPFSVLRHDLLGALRRAGIGKIPDWLIVLANNVDNLVVVLMSQTVGLNPNHIGIAIRSALGEASRSTKRTAGSFCLISRSHESWPPNTTMRCLVS